MWVSIDSAALASASINGLSVSSGRAISRSAWLAPP
jgi:hypothetical protein